MKIGTAEHPKTYDLAARLDAPIPLVLGYLELLWQFAAQHCPQGNIGKWSDAAISRACQAVLSADLDAVKFVEALTESGFLDCSGVHRLVIHDWRDHMPAWVAAKLKRESKSVFKAETGGCNLDSTKPPLSADSGPTSNQAKPSQANKDGADAPTVWDVGVGLGIDRGVIGKAIKKHGEEIVAGALVKTQNKRAADPKTYFLGCLPKTEDVHYVSGQRYTS